MRTCDEIINEAGADRLVAAVIHTAVQDYQARTPGAYGSAKVFLRSCGLLHGDVLDERLQAGREARRKAA